MLNVGVEPKAHIHFARDVDGAAEVGTRAVWESYVIVPDGAFRPIWSMT